MIEIDLDINPKWKRDNDWLALSQRPIYEAIELSDYSFLQKIDNNVSISILLSDNETIHTLNQQYRSKDKPTDILSFPMVERSELSTLAHHPIHEILLGDIILSHDICHSEAKEKGISLKDHYQHLIVHGILHLLGYNHIDDDDADKMQSIEILALKKMGIKNPYEKG